ncbi:MAG: VPLPA-CTERM-specific exosortase XrtD [Gammaproteobacteria bacterium]|nr:VPLPA-CTERM-specific exosortase XrtD [Gammaproteobacteria bacterium]
MKLNSIYLNNIYFLLATYLLIAGVVFYASYASLVVMENMWSSKEEYGYAYLIPFISGFFIWQKVEEIERAKFEPSILGGIFFIGSMMLILLGVLSATHSITQYGFVMVLIAIVHMLMGSAVLRVVIAPMLLLFVMVPLPAFLFNNLSSYLQLLSSQLGVFFIRLFDISVYLEGNVIDLGSYKLQVVEACSGLRYLFPLFSLALIASYIYSAAMWKRVVLVLSSIPITVLMNSFRIGIIGVLVEYWGQGQAEGFLHDFEGWVIFMFCTAFLILEMWVLLKIDSNGKNLSDVFAIDIPESRCVKFNISLPSGKYFIMTIVAIMLGISVGLVNERQEVIVERNDFSSFPLSFENWTGYRDVLESPVLRALKLDDYVIADYVDKHGSPINLYVAYYAAQRSGQAAHSPKSCIPGGGWRINDFSTITGLLPSAESEVVNRLIIAKADEKQLVYYWFSQRGRIIANEYMVKWYLFWDALTLNRTDGALVRFAIPVSSGEDINKADERMVNFIRLVWPHMSEYIPD